jgi:hypothetical protein
VTDSAVTHHTDGFTALGSGFATELTKGQNRTVTELLWHAMEEASGEGRTERAAYLKEIREKLREQGRQHGWWR